MDTKRYARFTRPGHAVTGDRTSSRAEKREQVGYEYAHAIIDDHTRLTYSELHPDERADTVVAFTQRALASYAQHGITPKRVMTDNARNYTRSRASQQLLAAATTSSTSRSTPRRPQTNGKIERFHQTMARERGYGLTYRSSTHRAHALPHWLNHYNEPRPHSATRQPATHQPRTAELFAPLIPLIAAVRAAGAAPTGLRAGAAARYGISTCTRRPLAPVADDSGIRAVLDAAI